MPGGAVGVDDDAVTPWVGMLMLQEGGTPAVNAAARSASDMTMTCSVVQSIARPALHVDTKQGVVHGQWVMGNAEPCTTTGAAGSVASTATTVNASSPL